METYERKNTIPEVLNELVKNLDGIEKRDPVNHPSHYETGKFECIDVMREALGDAAVLDFCLCNAFKYIYRTNRKNGLEDIKKAKWYIDKYLEILDDSRAIPATGSIK